MLSLFCESFCWYTQPQLEQPEQLLDWVCVLGAGGPGCLPGPPLRL